LDAGRILVVEDDDSIRMLIRTVLARTGRHVIEAANGLAGLRAAQDERPDLILLDLGLPGMHGSEVLEHLQADEALKQIPVIIVSAWADEITAKMARSRGAVDVVHKPFDIDDLADRVDAALNAAGGGSARRPGAA
jgi:DNA-binding response OmpR family regulator